MCIKGSSVFVFVSFFFILGVSISISISISEISETMAESSVESTVPSSTAVYIVYTEKPAGDVKPESLHLQTLSSVLGSEEDAKDALIYVYKTAATGFSAKLTPDQVAELQKQPGVIQVVPDRTLQLHSGVGTNNART